jgi:hypothetical protein
LLYITGAVRFLNRRHLHHHLQDNHAIANNQQLPAATSLAAPLAHPLFQAMFNWNLVQHLKIQLKGECSAATVISEFDQETLYVITTPSLPVAAIAARV